MKKFLGLLLMLMMIASNCLAMTFSQPVEIGRYGQTQARGGPGFLIEGASYNDGDFFTKYEKNNRRTYGKGTARWGNGENALYAHYNAYNDTSKIGGKDLNNTIKDNYAGSPIIAHISQINTDSSMIFYIFFTSYDLPEENNYALYGRQSNGKWVKYFDTLELTKKYFGVNQGYCLEKLSVNKNTISIHYKLYQKGNYRNPTSSGEFRFKWDDKAQWFGVEQVVY